MAKILLVEDDNNLREIYEARLQAEGYDIVAARDGEEALVVAKAEHPDLVISDVMMPKISGFEMLDILRNTEGLQQVKVIMLTALGQSEDQQRADSLGADRYLVKSQVTLEDIVNVSQLLLTEAGAIAAPVDQTAPAAEATPAYPPTPDPVAATPAPQPAAAEPVATPEAATPIPATDQPQTAAQEEAAVAQQIESFVATQSGAAPAQVAPAAEPTAIAPETTTPETTTQDEQQQVLANAARDLSGEAPPTATQSPSAAGSGQAAAAEPATDDSGTTTHKKVIQPLSTDEPNKKSLDQLLAEEAAKQTGAVIQPQPPAAPSQPPAGPQPTAAPQPAKPVPSNGDFDPNSIAL